MHRSMRPKGRVAVLRIDRRSAQNFDWLLLGLTVLLVGLGLANLWSATASTAGDGMAPELRRQRHRCVG